MRPNRSPQAKITAEFGWSTGRAGCKRDRAHLAGVRTIQQSMRLLRLLTGFFVNTFGITPPTAETERSAGRAIAIMLAVVAALLGVAVWVLRSLRVR